MRVARNYVSGRVIAGAVLCCAVLCCAVLCCAVLCCAVLCCAVNFDTKREIMSSGLEKNLVFLHGFANIICIITRKFDFQGKFCGNIEKI